MEKKVKAWAVIVNNKLIRINRRGKKTIETVRLVTGSPGKWKSHIETIIPCEITYKI